MTPTEVGSIRSRVPRGDGAGALLETIFVTVVFYRDYQYTATVEGMHARTAHPKRIQVAVVDQILIG